MSVKKYTILLFGAMIGPFIAQSLDARAYIIRSYKLLPPKTSADLVTQYVTNQTQKKHCQKAKIHSHMLNAIGTIQSSLEKVKYPLALSCKICDLEKEFQNIYLNRPKLKLYGNPELTSYLKVRGMWPKERRLLSRRRIENIANMLCLLNVSLQSQALKNLQFRIKILQECKRRRIL